jgi:DNA-directed RNA polymerase specialized sigma24 family protein
MCPMRDAAEAARLRLITTTSNLAGSIRACQLEGMTPKQIGEVMGLSAVTVRLLINSWGLNR